MASDGQSSRAILLVREERRAAAVCHTSPVGERDARELVAEYVERVWNRGDSSAVVDLCADPYVRHDAGGSRVMSHADQLDRVTGERAAGTAADGRSLHFETLLLAGDGRDVTWVWNMTGPTGTELADSGVEAEVVAEELRICGNEVFRVVAGRIAEVWYSPPMPGHWG